MDASARQRLIALGEALINQQAAQVIVPPQADAEGYWFGGGNLVEGPNGDFYLVGRYRHAGDSRLGLGAGERGLELAIFHSADSRSVDRGRRFTKLASFAKGDLDVGERTVLSIEGSALHFTESGVELFVSTEKSNIGYPAGLEAFLKPNTGVWTIELLQAATIAGLAEATPKTILSCADPRWLHVKDPFLYEPGNGELVVGFCTHPYCWTSSNSAYSVRKPGTTAFSAPVFDFFPRGFAWDVAMSRATAWLPVPRVGVFADLPPQTLIFYDGGESVRNLDEHKAAVSRPRGYSCEELGGLAVADASGVQHIERLSINQPLFVSPHGLGTSRYVDVLVTTEGYYATWQQSQPDRSQPLVMNFLSHEEVHAILK
ncbi:MAG: hypothetical protein KDE53_30585 [Caldilineaceae bacterium]|nr:hypothetical protein [Caldilineaceae bacterium]